MTNKEAIKMLDRIRDETGWTNNAYNSLTLAIEALEKQIPKKPKLKKFASTFTASVCPNCGSMAHHAYCPECGQAIDWSDDE